MNYSKTDLSYLNLPNDMRYKFDSLGLRSVEDLLLVSESELSELTNEKVDNIHELVESVKNELSCLNESDEMSGLEILKELELEEKKDDYYIKTYDNSINEFLNGGIRRGKIFEICGLNGVGKTSLCYELLIPFLINSIINKSDEKMLYIDSESSFNPFRLYSIIDNHLNKLNIENISVEEIMKRILFIRIMYDEEMNKMEEIINEIMKENNVKLIIIDSICYYYRRQINDTIHRAQKLSNFGLYLYELCIKYKMTIITTNHLSSRIIDNNNNNEYVSVLGDSWSEMINIRIKMYKIDGNNVMTGMKGMRMFNGICYMIDENGLRSLTN